MIVGLTGGICAGKSTATAELRALGANVLDCDDLARYLTDFDPQLRGAIRDNWPQAFYAAGGLNRRRLAEIVFGESAQRVKLEQILHPLILETVKLNVTAERQRGQHLVIVVPLLFELGMQDLFDATWLIACEPEVQLARLMQRNRLEAEEARRWLAAQWPLERKLPLATLVLRNDAKIDDLQTAVRSAWEGVLK